MIRVFIYLFVVCVLGVVCGWVANHNNVIVITFLNTRFAVSFATLIGAFILFLGILAFLWWLLCVVFSIPKVLSNYFHTRHQKHGREALSQGLLAAFAGDYVTAQKMEARVLKYLIENDEPLVKLLQAQIFFLQQNSLRSIGLYEEMRKEPLTRLAGLYGLFREAVNTKAYEAAQQYAEEALALSPALLWANQAVLDRLSAEGKWDKALDIFEKAQKALPRSARFTEERNHTHALLLSGKALHLFETHPVAARTIILKAHKLEPDFVPITVITTDILYKLNESRKADKMIIQAWKKEPHPDLGSLYLERGQGAVGRLKRAKALASHNQDTFESAFLIAKAALDAGEVELAREQAQKALHFHPRESAYLLLADIEEARGNDQGLVRQWLSMALHAERDPTWICDGILFSSWSVVSPVSGKLGCFEWKALPRKSPVTLEADNSMLKEEGKEDIVTEIAFVGDKSFAELPPIEDDFLHESSTKQRDKKTFNQIRLNVDDPGVKTEEDAPLSKEKLRLF
ncbi:heme biosynthesis protein HemY [Bartonella sp. A05]|uniref:heme biosynthesis protein HemY n=1 Tax=Bartonella sp. A05 TaxID=2967261 RepID=UPI0022A9D695|nr:heme biosynthesis HemY N-terminal domain-containing protein [Bartonella sp. A05]MCZ2203569.1 DNA-binding protein [Bartonella sp. A05]